MWGEKSDLVLVLQDVEGCLGGVARPEVPAQAWTGTGPMIFSRARWSHLCHAQQSEALCVLSTFPDRIVQMKKTLN